MALVGNYRIWAYLADQFAALWAAHLGIRWC
jgi:hypothetical protein